MFKDNNVDLDDVKGEQEGFLNSFMMLCNYVQVKSNDNIDNDDYKQTEHESIVEAISVLIDLAKTHKVKGGTALRSFLISTYQK